MKDYKPKVMTNEALQNLIYSWFAEPDTIALGFSEEGSQFLNITIHASHLHRLMRKLKTNHQTQFDYLFCLTGVDLENALSVVYHLESTIHRHILVVKVSTPDRENPVFDSIQDIWPTANFHEREVYDFFGIKFNGHPNLKRLFMPEDWDGFPLRKDYVDEINMVVR